MIKMNRHISARIVSAAAVKACAQKREALERQEDALAKLALETYLGDKITAFAAAVAISSGWFETFTTVSWHLRNNCSRQASFATERQLPHSLRYASVLIQSPVLEEAYQEFKAAKEALADDERTVRNKVTEMCNSFGTVEKLVAAWPECVELLPPEAKEGYRPKNLPVPRPDVLNRLIGLTPAGAAA